MLLLAISFCGLTGCKPPNESRGPTTALAVAPGSIALTYICGNSFRIRNTNATAVTVTWDVYNTPEKGTLSLAPKPVTGPYSETYFTTVNKGTVRVFEGGVLIQTKANDNKPACQLPSDTTRPPIPATQVFPDDSTTVVPTPDDPNRIYYRTLAEVAFKPTASGLQIREFLSRFGAVIVAGWQYSGTYAIQYPDPGPTWNDLMSLIQAMHQDPAVEHVVPLTRSEGPPLLN